MRHRRRRQPAVGEQERKEEHDREHAEHPSDAVHEPHGHARTALRRPSVTSHVVELCRDEAIPVITAEDRSRMPIPFRGRGSRSGAPTTANITNATMYGTCPTHGSPLTTTRTVPTIAGDEQGEQRATATASGETAEAGQRDRRPVDTEHLDRLLATLHCRGPIGSHATSGAAAMVLAAGDDLAALGLGLQALGDVHRVADHRVLEPAAAADRAGDHEAGVDADPRRAGRRRRRRPSPRR